MTSGWTENVRLTRSYHGIEFYHPPLRAPAAAGALALFGVAGFIPGCFAAMAVAPLSESGAAGMLGIWLMSIFILPFVAFGVLFVAMAVYLVANSLTVSVTASEIRSLRRVFGIALRERRVARDDITALDAVAALRNRWPGVDTVYYSLVARTRSGAGLTMKEAYRTGRLAQFRNRNITVAESLRGEALMEQVKAEIIQAGRLEHLAAQEAAGRAG